MTTTLYTFSQINCDTNFINPGYQIGKSKSDEITYIKPNSSWMFWTYHEDNDYMYFSYYENRNGSTTYIIPPGRLIERHPYGWGEVDIKAADDRVIQYPQRKGNDAGVIYNAVREYIVPKNTWDCTDESNSMSQIYNTLKEGVPQITDSIWSEPIQMEEENN